MLTEICAKLHNYFLVPNGIHKGEYKIEGGKITPLDFLQEGQYFRIVGSVFNDGVHRYAEADLDLTDEAFSGAIWALAIPPKLVDLSREIKAFARVRLASPARLRAKVSAVILIAEELTQTALRLTGLLSFAPA